MRVYLDNCCFNRPFDDLTQPRVKAEAEAVVTIQSRIANGGYELVWSYVLDYEIENIPSEARKDRIQAWESVAILDVLASEDVLMEATCLIRIGLKTVDALHVACAISGECDFFLSTDDRILSRTQRFTAIRTLNPTDFLAMFP